MSADDWPEDNGPDDWPEEELKRHAGPAMVQRTHDGRLIYSARLKSKLSQPIEEYADNDELCDELVELARKENALGNVGNDEHPLARSEIDARALIRESRAYEATTGPPRAQAKNELGPAEGQGLNSLSPLKESTRTNEKSAATLIRHSRVFQPQFRGRTNAPEKSSAAAAVRPSQQEDVADAQPRKTVH